MKKLHVAIRPVTNRIFCGGVLKDGMPWASNKTDVTGEACAAVAQHAIERGEPVVVTANGVPKWEITVRELPLTAPKCIWPDCGHDTNRVGYGAKGCDGIGCPARVRSNT